ncbi:hypothetical protein I551_7261 [Mycobacterium ulcerans str. Harvey]|uniref:Uncharacterized protein n=1 Tax=Mycobacterium ulcerans str. Harvey TaxID=1299332 RepID=A0ABP3A4A2_MYCUL|nr:hypothetical protein I551_7261 [Mycobacterium ulcerans str. Harvey]
MAVRAYSQSARDIERLVHVGCFRGTISEINSCVDRLFELGGPLTTAAHGYVDELQAPDVPIESVDHPVGSFQGQRSSCRVQPESVN